MTHSSTFIGHSVLLTSDPVMDNVVCNSLRNSFYSIIFHKYLDSLRVGWLAILNIKIKY